MADNSSGYTPNYKPSNPDIDFDSDTSTAGDQGDQESDTVDFEESDSSGGSEVTQSENKEIQTGKSEKTRKDSKVIGSEPSGSSQAELTESDTQTVGDKVLDEDQVIKENEAGTKEQESFSQIENRLKQLAQENRGRRGRQAGNALQALKKAQSQGQATLTQTQEGLKILGRKQEKDRPPSVGDRLTNSKQDNNFDLDGRTGKTTVGEKLFKIGKQGTFAAQKAAKEVQTNTKLAEQIAGNADAAPLAFQNVNPFKAISTGITGINVAQEQINRLNKNQNLDRQDLQDIASVFTPIQSEEENKAQATVGSELVQDSIEDTSAVVGGIGAASAITRKNLRNGNAAQAGTAVGSASLQGLNKQKEVILENSEEIRQEAIGLVGDLAPIGIPGAAVSVTPTTKISNSLGTASETARKVGSEVATLRANSKKSKSTSQQAIESLALNKVEQQTGQTATATTDTQTALDNPINQPETSEITQESNFVPKNTNPEVLDIQSTTSTKNTTQTKAPTASNSTPITSSQDDVLAQPESDVLSRPESEILDTPATETESTPSSNVLSSTNSTTETLTETIPELKTELIPETNQKTTTQNNQQEENNSDNILDGLVGDQKEFERTVSVGADLLGLKSNKNESKISAGNPLNLRPELT